IRTCEVSAGRAGTAPPYGVRARRTLRAPSRTQAGHWNPTAAGIMQSGQIVRSHRWQRMPAGRSGWKAHTPAGDPGGGPAGEPGGGTDGGTVSSAALHRDGLDDDGVLGAVHRARGDRGDGVDDVAAGLVGHLAEDGVRVVQPRRRADGDEELRAVRARAGVGHRQQVGPVELQLGVELVLELVAGAAGAGAERATALDHEALDDPVEAEAVVEPAGGLLAALGVDVLLRALRQADEVLHR